MKTIILIALICFWLLVIAATIIAWIVINHQVQQENQQQELAYKREQEQVEQEKATQKLYEPISLNYYDLYLPHELKDLINKDKTISIEIRDLLSRYHKYPESYELALADLRTYDDDSKFKEAVSFLKQIFKDKQYMKYILSHKADNTNNVAVYRRILGSFETVIDNKKHKLAKLHDLNGTYTVMQKKHDEDVAASGDLTKMNTKQKSLYYAEYYKTHDDDDWI